MADAPTLRGIRVIIAGPLHEAPPMRTFANARYTVSATGMTNLPTADRPEVAFAGRSNAGKSSALNVLTARKGLARVSKTPGRTQLLNFFECDGVRLVDLPGYGFAKVPPKMRQAWGRMIGDFMRYRETLVGVVVVMDVRHPLTPFDEQMLGWSVEHGKPVLALLTKADKLSFGRAKAQRLAVEQALRDAPGISVRLMSATKRTGVDEARAVIEGWLPTLPAVPADDAQ